MTATKDMIYAEEFNFILNNEDGVISVSELIDHLSNLNQLVKSINHTLNKEYSIGVDQVFIDVIALEKGSFRINTRIKKLVKQGSLFIAGAATTAVIGAIVNNVFSNEEPQVTYVFNNCNVEINNGVVMSNKDTVKAVSKIAKTITESDSTSSLAIEYQTQNNELKDNTIEKSKLSALIVDDRDEKDKNVSTEYDAKLVIVSPVLEIKQASWRVRLDNQEFSAKMIDNEFLESLSDHSIAFGKGDTITADIETITVMKNDNTPNVRRYIKKVHKYPKYQTQSSEKTLFD